MGASRYCWQLQAPLLSGREMLQVVKELTSLGLELRGKLLGRDLHILRWLLAAIHLVIAVVDHLRIL